VTAVSDVTLDGANVTVAFESALVIVPPVVGETTVEGGDRPLAVLAFGSGGVASAPVGVVYPVSSVGCELVEPTTTLIVPVPEPAAVAGGVVLAAGSFDGVVVASVEVVVVVEGADAFGSVGFVVMVVEEPVEVPLVSVVEDVVVTVGAVTAGSAGGWIAAGSVGGKAEVSVVGAVEFDCVVVDETVDGSVLVVAGVVELVLLELVPFVACAADCASAAFRAACSAAVASSAEGPLGTVVAV
jgi:hypothetical protein